MLYSLFHVKLHKNINISQLYLLEKLKIPFNAGATTEPAGETSNLRAQDLRSLNVKTAPF